MGARGGRGRSGEEEKLMMRRKVGRVRKGKRSRCRLPFNQTAAATSMRVIEHLWGSIEEAS